MFEAKSASEEIDKQSKDGMRHSVYKEGCNFTENNGVQIRPYF